MMRLVMVCALAAGLSLACSSGGSSPLAGAAGSGGAGTTGAAGGGGAGTTGEAGGGGAGTTGAAGATDAAADSTGAAGGPGDAGATDAAEVGADAMDAPGGDAAALPKFSFFITSMAAMQRLSKSQKGFGGDLRYGETDGLEGADKICREIAETSMPGAGAKGWHAFLSAAAGPVHAIDRVGNGPWYDRKGRTVATSKAALLNVRPMDADPAIINDLPNEDGVPNHLVTPSGPDMHDDNPNVLTGSDANGHLFTESATCLDWTSKAGIDVAGRPRIGFGWVMGPRTNWISGLTEGGCGAGIVIVEMGGPTPDNPVVGSGGGYGAIYCFADVP